MLKVISSAVITIILSFVSGVLLDTYKNLAPRIVCSIGKGVSMKLRNKKIRAYTLTIRNISNKTIHDLTLNVQGHYDNLKAEDAKITRGLKFDVSNEDNNYCVSIPFLSKNDEFSVKLFVEKVQEFYKKPVVTLRSPENFKEIESEEQNGFLASLLNVPESIGGIFKRKISHNKELDNSKSENSFVNKKVIAAIASIILIIFISVLGIQHYAERNKVLNGNAKAINEQQTSEPSNQVSNPQKNSKNKSSTDKTNKNSNNNSSSEGTSNTPSGEKSNTPSSSKNSKPSTNESEAKSKEESSNNKSEEKLNDKATNSNSENSEAGKGNKGSSTTKSKESTETKNQKQNEKAKEGGSEAGTTTNPSEAKGN